MGVVAVGLRGSVLHMSPEGEWTVIPHPHDDRDFYSICYNDDGAFWVGGTEHSISRGAIGDEGLVFEKITNLNLANDSANRTPGIVGVDCSISEVWVGGTSDVSVSQDGGDTWKTKQGFVPKPGSGSGRIIDIARDQEGHGYLLALDGTVYRSVDYGFNWNEAAPDFSPEDWWLDYSAEEGTVPWAGMVAMAAPGNGLGIVVGAAGVVRYRSTEGVWNEATLPEEFVPTSGLLDGTQEIFAVHFSNATNGCIAGGSGLLMHTTDGGLSWTEVQTGYGDDFSAVFCTETEAHVAGAQGRIYKGSLTGE
jgi:photosystem II stability/assembly factor-like uncharacterized protein